MDAKEQIAEWVDMYGDRLLRVAFVYAGDTFLAEDRVQEAFLRTYRVLRQGKEIDQPFYWLVRVIINECRRYGQTKRKQDVVMSSISEPILASTEEIYLRKLTSQNLYQALLRLPDKYRAPIILFHLEEIPIAQIADILQLSISAVKTRLSRGRKKIGKMMKEEYDNDHQLSEC